MGDNKEGHDMTELCLEYCHGWPEVPDERGRTHLCCVANCYAMGDWIGKAGKKDKFFIIGIVVIVLVFLVALLCMRKKMKKERKQHASMPHVLGKIIRSGPNANSSGNAVNKFRKV